MGEPELVVVGDPDAVAAEAAERVVAQLGAAVRERGIAHLALTGGSSAVPLYRRLSDPPLNRALDWSRVHFWWGDDRYVPADHPESNTGLAYGVLLHMDARMGESGEGAAGTDLAAGVVSGLAVDPTNVHPIPTNQAIQNARGIEWAANEYANELRGQLPLDGTGTPVFDLILAGAGPDGHILSVFPGSDALRSDTPLVLAVPAPEHVAPHLPRITLAPAVLGVARRVLVMVTGAAKAERVAQILRGPLDPERLPAQLARRENATWLLDEAAASRLG